MTGNKISRFMQVSKLTVIPDQTVVDYSGERDTAETNQRELHSDGSLSERTLEVTAGLLARSPLLALCKDEVSLHRERSFTTVPLAPLYPESGLLLESTCMDFTGAGSTASVTSSSAAADEGASTAGTDSEDGGVVAGMDVGTHGSLVVARS